MKVAILGTIPYSRNEAPFDDHEWEIWVCSPGNHGDGVVPRVTRWFEIHGIDDVKGAENAGWNKTYFDWLNKQTFPVYMQEPNDLIPQCRIFPQKRWLKEFGNFGRMAATSSISIMMGFAIMEGATEIGVFGVDMQADEEQYTLQKSGCQIMMELARQRGIHVIVPTSSCLSVPPPFYGYAEASRMGRRLHLRRMELQQALAHHRGQADHHVRTAEHIAGQIQQLTYALRTFVDGVDDIEIDVDEHDVPIGLNLTAHVMTNKGMTVWPGMPAVPGQVTVVPQDIGKPEEMPCDLSDGGILIPRQAAE